jgi:hypothetical protein
VLRRWIFALHGNRLIRIVVRALRGLCEAPVQSLLDESDSIQTNVTVSDETPMITSYNAQPEPENDAFWSSGETEN